ncbi:MAG: MBL fold metallo-hydrolase [Dehalococcoidia bacterium]|nr:MBL fold metallo-hydrolase [Dehalococcoidia bacterium]
MADRTSVGEVEILSFIDMVPPPYDPEGFFPDVNRSQWQPYEADHLENGNLQLYYGCFALRSRGQTILVDTGMGPGPHPTRGNLTGSLVPLLREQGIGPEDVNIVVHTHLHPDHVGWNVTYEGGKPKATFPKARYLVPRKDWSYFTQEDVLASAAHVRDNVVPLQDLGAMDIIDEEHTITSEITTIPTPGHTPGHLNVLIASAGEKGILVGDMLHSKVQVQEPGWCSRADIDKATGQRSREETLERIEQEGMLVAAGHFKPDEHFGRVVRIQGRRYWQVL